jgi:hypothetical protein
MTWLKSGGKKKIVGPGQSAKRVFAQDIPAIHVLASERELKT